MNALTLPNSVASNKRPSPSLENALFKINARAFNRIFTVFSSKSEYEGDPIMNGTFLLFNEPYVYYFHLLDTHLIYL